MADARTQHDWNRTAAVLAQIYNCHKGKHQPAKKPADYHPCPPARRPRPTEYTSDLSILKQYIPDDEASA